MADHDMYLREAVAIARTNVEEGGRPYGAVIVQADGIVVRAANRIHVTQDPTDHAEMVALRAISRALGRPKLEDCTVYASGRPCPMCHAAMRLAGVKQGFFAFTAEDAEAEGLLGAGIYAELCLPLERQPMQLRHKPVDEADNPYRAWSDRNRS